MDDDMLEKLLAMLDRADCPKSRWPDRRGDFWPRCPFHTDQHSGSFAVGKKGYVCFACGAYGSLRQLARHLGV